MNSADDLLCALYKRRKGMYSPSNIAARDIANAEELAKRMKSEMFAKTAKEAMLREIRRVERMYDVEIMGNYNA